MFLSLIILLGAGEPRAHEVPRWDGSEPPCVVCFTASHVYYLLVKSEIMHAGRGGWVTCLFDVSFFFKCFWLFVRLSHCCPNSILSFWWRAWINWNYHDCDISTTETNYRRQTVYVVFMSIMGYCRERKKVSLVLPCFALLCFGGKLRYVVC